MITLLGSLLGFGTSFLPEVLGYFRANQEHKHSMQKAQLEIDLMSKRSELKLQIMDLQRIWTSSCAGLLRVKLVLKLFGHLGKLWQSSTRLARLPVTSYQCL